MQTFIFKKIDIKDAGYINQIFRLRFLVYGRECGFIAENDYPNGLETDEFDSQSIHFAAVNRFQEVIGATRLVLPGKLGLPLEKYCDNLVIDKGIDRKNLAEISRVVVSKRLRRKWFDRSYYGKHNTKNIVDNSEKAFLRCAKPLAFGLYREAFYECTRRGITHVCALMEEGLATLMRIYGFSFTCIGEEVDVFGSVKPYLFCLSDIQYVIFRSIRHFNQHSEIPFVRRGEPAGLNFISV